MPVGTDRYKYGTFTTAGTITLSDGTPCVLHSLSLTDTTAGNITVKNGTTTTAATALLITAGTQMTYGPLDIELGGGLVVVTSGNTKGMIAYTLI
jgi:hypothetical protein